MQFLNWNYIELEHNLVSDLSSPLILELRADTINKKILSNYQTLNSEKIYNKLLLNTLSELLSNATVLDIEKAKVKLSLDFSNQNMLKTFLEKMGEKENQNIADSLLLIPRTLIDYEEREQSRYRFKEKFCEELKIEKVNISQMNSSFEYRTRAIFSLNKKTARLSNKENIIDSQKKIEEHYKNNLKLCKNEFNNFITSSMKKMNFQYYNSYAQLLEKQKTLLLKSKPNVLSRPELRLNNEQIEIEQVSELKKKILEELNSSLKTISILTKNNENEKNFFMVTNSTEQTDIRLKFSSNINKFSIFFIISLMSSVIFFVIISLLKKRYSKS